MTLNSCPLTPRLRRVYTVVGMYSLLCRTHFRRATRDAIVMNIVCGSFAVLFVCRGQKCGLRVPLGAVAVSMTTCCDSTTDRSYYRTLTEEGLMVLQGSPKVVNHDITRCHDRSVQNLMPPSRDHRPTPCQVRWLTLELFLRRDQLRKIFIQHPQASLPSSLPIVAIQ